MSSKKTLQKCPCCQQDRRHSECQLVSKQIRVLIGDYPNKVQGTNGQILGNYYGSRAYEGNLQWACDECIESKRAIAGKPSKQLFLDYPPHFAYFDQEKVCRGCQEVFVFEKEEQQHWYEHLRFWVQATRVYCKKCQSDKKQRDRLSQLLMDFDYADTEKLKEIVAFYVSRKEYQKAKHHLKIALKQRPKESAEYTELSNWASEIKELEKNEKPNS